MDLAEKAFEAVVFGAPCADLGEQVFGDIDGAGLAVLLEGEVLAGVEGPTVVAAAGRTAAAVAVGAEGGGDDGAGGGELFEAVLEYAEDEGGVVGDRHAVSRRGREWPGVRRFSRREAQRPGATRK
jgi:hypothetical protein